MTDPDGSVILIKRIPGSPETFCSTLLYIPRSSCGILITRGTKDMNTGTSPYSQLKIFHHPEILENLKNKRRCAPLYIRLKPTNRCNHNCSYCHYRNPYLTLDEYDGRDEIPHDKMMEIIRDMADMGVKAVTFSGGGEPLLYPYIEEAMERILEAGIDLSIITNGSLLSGKKAQLLSRAKWVRISLESTNDEQYGRIRGLKQGAFDQLCENIQAFSRMKSRDCEFGINMVVSEKNHGEVIEMAKLMKELGVNHVKYSPLVSNDTRGYHAPFRERVTESLKKAQEIFEDERFRIIDLYTGDFANSVIFKRSYHRCAVKEFICVIAANARVYYCHDKAYLSDGCIGDLSENSFRELWYSPQTDERFRRFDAQVICGQHCVYDSRNELIRSFLEMDQNHINFI